MELWHVLNRGVDKRTIFHDDQDRARYVHDMYEFNDTRPAPDTYRTMWDLRSPTLRRERTMIVNIHGWCLMRSHYHLLLSERVDGGITLFLRKLNIGYAKYFNERYKRSGTLFQGRTKKILIERNAHFLHILHYIHLNPLDLHKESAAWRELKLPSAPAARKHLESYRWSSYRDYCGERNFPSIIDTELFLKVFRDYKKTLDKYLRDIDVESIRPFTLE